jgi:hypothetical protein
MRMRNIINGDRSLTISIESPSLHGNCIARDNGRGDQKAGNSHRSKEQTGDLLDSEGAETGKISFTSGKGRQRLNIVVCRDLTCRFGSGRVVFAPLSRVMMTRKVYLLHSRSNVYPWVADEIRRTP